MENVQTSLRPGEVVDTFYYGDSNSCKSAYPCVVNTRFVQAFPNPGAGTSQFTISPGQGVSDIILQFQLGTGSGTTANLPTGWGYSLINQVSVRYGSSAQYFFTGQQVFLQNLYDCENSVKRDKMALLGGNALVGTYCQGATANVYLNLPHNSPRADGKPLPFPSDLLVQPIIITVQLNNPSAMVSDGGIFVVGASNGQTITLTPPLAVAQMCVKQEIMADSADLLARRVDMNSHAYTYPLKYFPQQQVSINLASTANNQTVNLTGFRAGEVQRILVWLTKGSDLSGQGNLYWRPMTNIQLTYNGEVFYRADGNTNSLWSLVQDTKTSSFATATGTSGAWNTAFDSTWIDMPFAQVSIPYDKEVKLVHGKPILNAVVNLQLNTISAASDYVLNCVYFYNSSLLMSRGGSEYIF